MALPSYACVCCNSSIEESLSHLFFTCHFAQSCWLRLNIILVESEPLPALEEIREQINHRFYMDIIITFYWSLWMQRNDFIFRGLQPTPDRCIQHFKKEFGLVILRAKTRHKASMLQWLEGLV